MIHILTTGGTIGGLDYKEIKDRPEQIRPGIEDFFRTANVSFDYKIDNVLNKDSRFINEEDRNVLSEKIKSSNVNKILVTHGTITMVETAKFLAKRHQDKKILLTGAFVLGTDANTDAPFNLGFAVSAIEYLDIGTYIAMNGKVFDWNNVRKNFQTNRFETLSE